MADLQRQEEQEDDTSWFDKYRVTPQVAQEPEQVSPRVVTEQPVDTSSNWFDKYRIGASQRTNVNPLEGYGVITPQPTLTSGLDTPENELVNSPRISEILSLYQEVKNDYTETDEDGNEVFKLNREDFFNDERVTRLMDEVMTARYGSGEYGVVGTAASWGATLTGAATARGWMGETPEQRFETFQNYQRKLAGGHSVTTANEIALLATLSDEDKAVIGIGYELFDATPGIFSEDTEWSETFDGLWDYGRAAIIDPVTVMSLGVGKALGSGSTKAASIGIQQAGRLALDQAIQSGLSRTAARQVAVEAMGQVAQAGAQTTIRRAATDIVRYSALDLAANIGTDIAYQSARMQTGVQEEYSIAQTGFSALGTLAIPAVVGAVRGLRAAYKTGAGVAPIENLDTKFAFLGDTAVREETLGRVNWDQVSSWLTDSFANVKDSLSRSPEWSKAIETARRSTEATDLTSGDNLFFKLLLTGDESLGIKSVPQAMSEAGFRFIRQHADDNVTNYISDAIRLLPENTVRMMVDNFQEAADTTLNLITKDTLTGEVLSLPESLARTISKRSSDLGTNQAYMSIAASTLRSSGNTQVKLGDVAVGDYLDAISNNFMPKVAAERVERTLPFRIAEFSQAQIKRLMTSHLATTASNIRGWGALYGMQTLADAIHGTLLLGKGFFTGGPNGTAYREGAGLLRGVVQRGYNILDPNATSDAAAQLYNVMPEVGDVLNAVLSGDSGVTDAITRFGLDPTNKIVNGAERVTDFLQGITGVKLQHEVTTNISFMSALQTNVLREYGQNYAEFLSTRKGQEALVEMYSERFINNVITPSVHQAQRETASLSFGAMGQANRLSLRPFAKAIEEISNTPGIGLMIPFGRFFNNTMATLGDYSGLNLGVHIANRAFNKIPGVNIAIHKGEEEGLELLAKAIVGVTGALTFSYAAEDNIKLGFSWSQTPSDSGKVLDNTYDWPESAFRIVGYMLAHKRMDGEVPDELQKEAATILVGQTFRQLDDSGKVFYSMIESLLGGDFEQGGSLMLDSAMQTIGRTVSSATRFLDPVNQMAIYATGQNRAPDRRQGYSFFNEAIRNVDGIFGLRGDMPERNTPTRVSTPPLDLGKQLGVRTGQQPTAIERMMASVGRPSWTAARFSGPPEVTNRLTEFFSNFVNVEAERIIADNPDFFDPEKTRLPQRQRLVEQALKSARDSSVEFLRNMTLQSEDRRLAVLYDINTKLSKRDLELTLRTLGFDDDLVGIIGQPNDLETLELILSIGEDIDNFLDRSVGR